MLQLSLKLYREMIRDKCSSDTECKNIYYNTFFYKSNMDADPRLDSTYCSTGSYSKSCI